MSASDDFCEPCSYHGYRDVPAHHVIGWDYTPVCEFHAGNPFTRRDPTMEERETHVPRKGIVGEIVGVEFQPSDITDGRIVVRVAVEDHHRVGKQAVEIVPR